MVRRKNEIDRNRLLFVSLFVFFLVFPYSYFGYLAFFPDIFSILLAYWISSDEKKSYGVIVISGVIGILKVSLGGDIMSSVFFVILGLVSTFYPDFFEGNLFSVLRISALTSFFSALFESNWVEFLPESIAFIILKVVITSVFAFSIYPFVIVERRKIML